MLDVSRRRLLASSAAAVAVVGGSRNASAYLARRPGGSLITTITLVNGGGNQTSSGTVTQLIGCPFSKGDIPKYTWPQFQLAGGINVPCTILDRLATRWKDGSLKFVPVMLSIPEALPANGKLAVNVLSGGQMPAPSPRRLSDFHQGIAPQVQVDGLDNLSGTWTMHLKQAIKTRTSVVQYGNGAAGAVWKVRANAQQSGADHGQLVCDFYIASIANPDGSLKGLRILGKVKLPYYDTNAAMNWMSFSRFQLCLDHRGTIIRDCFGSNFGAARAYSFAWKSGSTFEADSGYSTKNYGDYGYCTRLTTTGALPAGLSTNTSYFTGKPTATTIGFATNASNPGAFLVSASDSGSGIHTATPYPYLAYFGALFTAGPGGVWDFVQGAGSDSADTSLFHQIDQHYWLATKVVPPYNLALGAVTGNAPTSYWPNCSEPVTRYLHTTGERDDLGIIHAWGVRHFFTQGAVDLQVIRVVSLVGAQLSVGLENSQTLTYPCVNNGPGGAGAAYRGMPVPDYSFRWAPGETTPAGTFSGAGTLDPNVLIAGFSEQDATHMCQFNYYTYLVTGEPWHLDALLEAANNTVMNASARLSTAKIDTSTFLLDSSGNGNYRNVTVGTNPPRYGALTGSASNGGFRNSAWSNALLGTASGICPDSHPVCSSYKHYFGDMSSDSWNLALDIWNQLKIGGCTYGHTYGFWMTPQCGSNFDCLQYQMFGYMVTTGCLNYTLTENPRAAAAIQAFLPWADHVVAKWSGWHLGAEQAVIKQSIAAGAPVIASDAQAGFGVTGPVVHWTNSGATPFSWPAPPNPTNYAMANGDRIMFVDTCGSNPHKCPGGYSKYTSYYVVDFTGQSFSLALTAGGTALAPPTDIYSGTDQSFFISSNPPLTGSVDAVNGSTSFNTLVLHGLLNAQACGLVVKSATIADLQNRENAANYGKGVSFSSCPKYALIDTFNQQHG